MSTPLPPKIFLPPTMSMNNNLCSPATFSVNGGGINWPVALGRKGPSWFLVYDKPRGMSFAREYAVLNTLNGPEPFPPSSPDGHPRFLYSCPQVANGLSNLLSARAVVPGTNSGEPANSTLPVARRTGRRLGDGIWTLPEIEVLLSEEQILQACANCEKWEAVRRPRFLRCSACKARYYCSASVWCYSGISVFPAANTGLLVPKIALVCQA